MNVLERDNDDFSVYHECGDISCHYDDSNEEIGEYEVPEKEKCNGEEFTATESMGAQFILQLCPAVCLHAMQKLIAIHFRSFPD